MSDDYQLTEIIGKTLTKIENIDNGKLIFHCDDGTSFQMWHEQDCCESVSIEEIIGDLDDLIGHPILEAVERTNSGDNGDYDSYTWTFYEFRNFRGFVTIRWLGTSNGYYSEGVSFAEINEKNEWRLSR